MGNFDIYDDELRYSRHDEIEKNYSLQEELKTHYFNVFKYDELLKYICANKKQIVESSNTAVDVINDIETGNVDKIIKLNKDNVTIQALITWKLQDIKTKQLISDF